MTAWAPPRPWQTPRSFGSLRFPYHSPHWPRAARNCVLKYKIFGRKVGSDDPMTVLMTGLGTVSSGKAVDPAELEAFSLASTRRAAQALRERGIEGYVLFDNDPTRYAFTPEADFVYPAARH